MLYLIITVIIGMAIAVFAAQNTVDTVVQLGPYVFEYVPLYAVILASFVSGILLSYLFYLAKNISTAVTINQLRSKVEQLKKDLSQKKQEVDRLKIETARTNKKEVVINK